MQYNIYYIDYKYILRLLTIHSFLHHQSAFPILQLKIGKK